MPRVWEHITDRARLRSKGNSRGPQREGETLSVRVLFCCAGLAQEDVSPCQVDVEPRKRETRETPKCLERYVIY